MYEVTRNGTALTNEGDLGEDTFRVRSILSGLTFTLAEMYRY